MPRRPIFALLLTGTALVLLLNFTTPSTTALASTGGGQVIAATPAAPAAANDTAVSGTTASGTAGTASAAGQPSATQTAAATQAASSNGSTAAAKSGTYTGSAVQMQYGTVQVQLSLTNGKITAVEPLQYPNDPHSARINQSAIPTLVQEVLAAQSAKVDTVSGATFTSEAFMQSVQSALDQANA